MALIIRNIFKPNVCNLFKCSKLSTLRNVNANTEIQCPVYMQLNSEWKPEHNETSINLYRDMTVYENFISVSEEDNLLNELEPYLKKMHYEFDHWDDAIHGFRETERLQWNEENTKIINRVRNLAFPMNVSQLRHVHVLDLAPKGYIKPHIDAVRFCGNTIAGMCLLSDCIMRLVHDKYKNLAADVLLKRRSLYVMKDTARYNYTHEVLPDETSVFKNTKIPRDRRISVICRNEPS